MAAASVDSGAEERQWFFSDGTQGPEAQVVVEASSMSQLEVNLSPWRLLVRDLLGEIALDLPFEVVPDECRARFRAKRRELCIVLQRLPMVQGGTCENAERLPHNDPAVPISSHKSSSESVLPHQDAAATSTSEDAAVMASDKGPDRRLAELDERPLSSNDPELAEALGNKAFAELRSLMSEGPNGLLGSLRRWFDEGRIDFAFCRVLRTNLVHAMEAEQSHKAQVFRKIQSEIKDLIGANGASPQTILRASEAFDGHQHAPRVEVASTCYTPRSLEPKEIVSAAPLRDHSALLGEGASKSKLQASRRSLMKLGQQVAERLQAQGWIVLDGLLDASEASAVRGDMEKLEPHFHASEIWVGNQAAIGAQMVMPEIRGDKVLWMCGHHPKRSSTPWSHANSSQREADFEVGEDPWALQPCSSTVRNSVKALTGLKTGGARRVQPSERWRNRNLSKLLDAMDVLAEAVRDSPAAGRCSKLADRSDAMLAVYPATGARFQRHVDNTAGDGRRLTMLCYMNQDWGIEDGGELCLHPSGSNPVIVKPVAGRLALFMADSIPHEVFPSRRHRYSINVWYYDTEERSKAAAEAKVTGRIGGTGAVVTDADNAVARHFLQELLGQGPQFATTAEVDRLAKLAALLPPGAAHMVAQVTMGSEAQANVTPIDLAKGLSAITPTALDGLRRDMTKMKTG